LSIYPDAPATNSVARRRIQARPAAMLPQHELEEVWVGENVTRTFWYSFQFKLGIAHSPDNVIHPLMAGDGHIEPEQQQDPNAIDDEMRHSRERYSIFVEPRLNSKKGYFQLRMLVTEWPMGLGFSNRRASSVITGHSLKTSDDNEEILRFINTAEFYYFEKYTLILYVKSPSSSSNPEGNASYPFELTRTGPPSTRLYIHHRYKGPTCRC
jgi:hypothetical protein